MEKSVKKIDFELFKSNTCQYVKKNAHAWAVFIMEKDLIRQYYNDGNILYALYTLAMLDKVLKRLGYRCPKEYNDLRELSFSDPVMPMSAAFCHDFDYIGNADSDFLKYNIVEGDVDNVY